MSTFISIEEGQAKPPEIIGQLTPGEEIVITKDQRPVAQLRSARPGDVRPQFGGCKGMLTILSEDDEHLEDFREYMPCTTKTPSSAPFRTTRATTRRG